MTVDGILNLIHWQWGWREVATIEISDWVGVGGSGEAQVWGIKDIRHVMGTC